MQSKILVSVLVLVSVAFAKGPKPFQRGKLVQMDSVACGADEKSAQSPTSEIMGSHSRHKQTHERLCDEYVLQADEVDIRVRPRDEKHPVLLPVGEWAQFRLQRDKLILRTDALDNKEREFIVVSMTTRSDENTAGAKIPHVNHLQ
jgi:hypothetical protein